MDVALTFGTANITRKRVVMASGNNFSRPLPAGDYSIEVSTRGGSSLLVKTSTFSPPTRLEADVWGGNAIRLNWDDNTDNEAFYRVDRWTRLGWRRGQYVPANYTAAVMDNLVPGHATTYRISAVTADGVSLRSANTVSATTESADTSGWYKVKLTKGMTEGKAGWIKENRDDPESPDYRGKGDTLKVWPEYQLNNSETQGDWIYASSWQHAAWTALGTYSKVDDQIVTDSAKVRVTFDRAGYHTDDTVYHNFSSGGDFKVGTGQEIATDPDVAHFKLPQTDASNNPIKYIALEDSYGGIDRDYDDFYWKLTVEEMNPKVSIEWNQLWWFGGLDASNYQESLDMSISDVPEGLNISWNIVQGSDKAGLKYAGHVADSWNGIGAHQLEIVSEGKSVVLDDVHVEIKVDGAVIETATFTIKAPTTASVVQVVDSANPVDNGIQLSGFHTKYKMEVADNFGDVVPHRLEVNENFPAHAVNTIPNNWGPYLANGSFTHTDGTFVDSYTRAEQWNPVQPGLSPDPVAPTAGNAGDSIARVFQEYRAGSVTPGEGLLIKTHDVHFRRGYARQETPAP